MLQFHQPQECGYKLRQGTVIQFFGESEFFTNQNLTDEVAERFLAQNPERKKMFIELPQNWQSRVEALRNQETSKPSDPAEEETEKLRARLRESRRRTKELEEMLKEMDSIDKERREAKEENGRLKKRISELEQMLSRTQEKYGMMQTPEEPAMNSQNPSEKVQAVKVNGLSDRHQRIAERIPSQDGKMEREFAVEETGKEVLS